jgi:hypothetical protein
VEYFSQSICIQHVTNGNCSIYHLRLYWLLENLISERGRPEMKVSHVNCGNALLYMVWGGGPRPLNKIWQALVQNFSHATPLAKGVGVLTVDRASGHLKWWLL